jgi:hypothetical protein
MLVVHQSFVPRRSISPEYRASAELCADYDWCIEILKKSPENIHVGGIITDYLMGGLSKKRHQQSLRNRFDVMRYHFGLVPTLLAHLWGRNSSGFAPNSKVGRGTILRRQPRPRRFSKTSEVLADASHHFPKQLHQLFRPKIKNPFQLPAHKQPVGKIA